MKNTSRIEVLNSCDSSRRDFIKTTGAGLTLAAAGPLASIGVAEKKKKVSTPETLSAKLYKSLNEKQRKAICFPWDQPLRGAVNNNWHITKTGVGDMEDDQIEMTKAIFNGLHSEQYRKAVMSQVVADHGKAGFDDTSIAFFGKPGTGKFEFVLTGRHVTRRADGDTIEGAAFGGPIFYGHAAKSFNEKPDHEGNVYWYQAKRANEVYQMLDGKQREKASLPKGRPEQKNATVKLTGKKKGLPGVRAGDLSKDQKEHMMKALGDVLALFRKKDVDESMKLIKANGVDNLHLAFFKNGDIGNDGVWDVWQLEGPTMVLYFRGAPHVHTWLHIRDKA